MKHLLTVLLFGIILLFVVGENIAFGVSIDPNITGFVWPERQGSASSSGAPGGSSSSSSSSSSSGSSSPDYCAVNSRPDNECKEWDCASQGCLDGSVCETDGSCSIITHAPGTGSIPATCKNDCMNAQGVRGGQRCPGQVRDAICHPGDPSSGDVLTCGLRNCTQGFGGSVSLKNGLCHRICDDGHGNDRWGVSWCVPGLEC